MDAESNITVEYGIIAIVLGWIAAQWRPRKPFARVSERSTRSYQHAVYTWSSTRSASQTALRRKRSRRSLTGERRWREMAWQAPSLCQRRIRRVFDAQVGIRLISK